MDIPQNWVSQIVDRRTFFDGSRNIKWAIVLLENTVRGRKGKRYKHTPWWRLGGGGVAWIIVLLINFGSRWRRVAKLWPQPPYTPGKQPRHQLNKRQSGRFGEDKTFPAGFRTSVRAVCSLVIPTTLTWLMENGNSTYFVCDAWQFWMLHWQAVRKTGILVTYLQEVGGSCEDWMELA